MQILERGSLTELAAAIMSVVQTTFDNLPGTHHHLLPEFDQGLARIREQHFTTPQIPVVGERVGVLLDLLIDSLVELPSFCPSTRAPGFRHGSVELGVGRSQVAGLAMDSEELKSLWVLACMLVWLQELCYSSWFLDQCACKYPDVHSPFRLCGRLGQCM